MSESKSVPRFAEAATSRGFERAEFTDANDNECSLQKSSSVDDCCVWLGVDWTDVSPTMVAMRTVDGTRFRVSPRMHLTRDMARDLARELLKFAYTGNVSVRSDLFKTCECMRTPEIQAKFNRMKDAVDADDVALARELIEELREDLGRDDPELVFHEGLLPLEGL